MKTSRIAPGIAPLLAAALLLAAPSARAEDHKDYKDASPQDCRDCHRNSGVPDNHGVEFLKSHRLLAQKTPTNCTDCHQQSFCVDCHQGGNLESDPLSSLSRRGEAMPRTHAPDIISTHPILVREEPRSCARCHESSRFCTDCHSRRRAQAGASFDVRPHSPVYVSSGVLDPSWVAFHSREARRNLASCQSCHAQKSDCSNFACHPGLGGR